jgi:hypothetical protein
LFLDQPLITKSTKTYKRRKITKEPKKEEKVKAREVCKKTIEEEIDVENLRCLPDDKHLFKTKQVVIGSKKDKLLDKQFKWDYQEYHLYHYPAQVGKADQYGIYQNEAGELLIEHLERDEQEERNLRRQRESRSILSRARLENSLGELTKKFMYLVRAANGSHLDLNEAA